MFKNKEKEEAKEIFRDFITSKGMFENYHTTGKEWVYRVSPSILKESPLSVVRRIIKTILHENEELKKQLRRYTSNEQIMKSEDVYARSNVIGEKLDNIMQSGLSSDVKTYMVSQIAFELKHGRVFKGRDY